MRRDKLMSEEARRKIGEKNRACWEARTPEEQKAQIDRCHTKEARAESSKKMKAFWEALPPEVKAERIAKLRQGLSRTRRSRATPAEKFDKRSKTYRDAHPEINAERLRKRAETFEKKRAAKAKAEAEKAAQEANIAKAKAEAEKAAQEAIEAAETLKRPSVIAALDTSTRFATNRCFKLDIREKVASVFYWWREEWIPVKSFRDEDPTMRRDKAQQLFTLLSNDGPQQIQ